MDVQRGHRDAATASSPVLPGEYPLVLVRVAGVVEPAGEDVVGAETGSRRVLVPRRPRHCAAHAREVDGWSLAEMCLIEVEGTAEGWAGTGAAPDGAAATRRPRA